VTDPDTANADQYAAWNGDSARRWTAGPDRRDRILAPVADAPLSAGGLTPRERVLDVGCGCGAPTLAADNQVTPEGIAWGIDLSEPMLDVARRRAEIAGVTNVRFEHADAQTHQLPIGCFDVAISRFGTMFFDNPAAAFRNVGRALRTSGRLCIATWQPLAANDWLTIPGADLDDALEHLADTGPAEPCSTPSPNRTVPPRSTPSDPFSPSTTPSPVSNSPPPSGSPPQTDRQDQ
jgi:SAM-dependent methyltransferase